MTSTQRAVLLAVWLACSVLPVHAAPPLEGRWEGTIAVPGAPIAIVLDLMPDPGSAWIGSVILPGFGIKGAPVGNIAVADDRLTLALTGALRNPGDDPPTVQARAIDAQTLSGEFRMSGLAAALRLTRTGAAQVDRPLASTRLAAALIGTWTGSYELGGYPREVTLTLAMEGDKPRAEMLIVGKRRSTVPFELIRQGEHFLTLQSAENGVSYEGLWRGADGEITGTFQQGPFEAPLHLRRASGGGS